MPFEIGLNGRDIFFLFLASANAVLIVLFVAVLLKYKHRPHLWLLNIFSVLFYVLLQMTVLSYAPDPEFLRFIRWGVSSLFLIGPYVYFYVLAWTVPNFQLAKKDYIHFLPFVVSVSIGSILALLSYFDQDNVSMEVRMNTKRVLDSIGGFVYLVFHLVLAHGKLREFDNWVENNYSNIQQRKLSWLRTFLRIVAVCCAIGLTHQLVGVWQDFYKPLPIGMFLFLSAVGYMAIARSNLFLLDEMDQNIVKGEVLPRTSSPHNGAGQPYERSRLSDDQLEKYNKKLLEVLNSKRLYVNNDLKIGDLAGELGISAHQVSQVINLGQKKTFFELISTYRVNEAKRLLKNPDYDHWTLLAIAEEVGFNSKSTFYTAFKKQTGVTPSEFKSQLTA